MIPGRLFFFHFMYFLFVILVYLLASSQHPFPYFGMRLPPAFTNTFAQIAEQVAADHPSIGVHVWDLGNALNQSLTIDLLHPTVQGHVALGKALAGRLRPLVTGA